MCCGTLWLFTARLCSDYFTLTGTALVSLAITGSGPFPIAARKLKYDFASKAVYLASLTFRNMQKPLKRMVGDGAGAYKTIQSGFPQQDIHTPTSPPMEKRILEYHTKRPPWQYRWGQEAFDWGTPCTDEDSQIIQSQNARAGRSGTLKSTSWNVKNTKKGEKGRSQKQGDDN